MFIWITFTGDWGIQEVVSRLPLPFLQEDVASFGEEFAAFLDVLLTWMHQFQSFYSFGSGMEGVTAPVLYKQLLANFQILYTHFLNRDESFEMQTFMENAVRQIIAARPSSRN